MKISLIVARTLNHVIGKENQMPWNLPVDLAWFRQNTLGKPVIMGRKTYESIGRLLPKRPNIILSRSGFCVEGAYTAQNFAQAAELAETFANTDEIMVIGGGELFKQTIPQADRLYLTEIQAEIEGDTLFEFDESNWTLVEEKWSEIDEQNAYRCRFMILERK
ncbi:type 3 dihydrofolate reductase [Actinobacillus pleuropneumoniae]|uniref:Dihydrofolate reductase n=5 Tax=Actinobacillus pleuropneumoniae TaxID=715 RepID=A3N0P3_ACTP2|nr:type 3 dihydrofolate reductase [Actinobacillus pleuropneumoniae]ABN73979.1 dihydrofolate reductase [Actinobacillus pleuropneumoniae serovar 5b str. L20]ACE61594.1 dihydrofolate reductase [Actinobacillus pleuropneumoniae serovar 7 str. AP76]ASU16858.1 Dihydrofolate reductase [Actinobacillus pleuropneumoniae]AWG95288.1 type 3 dihydrofolate reductase [Actinobacillus pleuropneumoniae serovar 1 str. 4074]AXA21359.1 type 3 dihydrofolate reductase [Actinobacillus pleuropneumoniae]